MSEHYDLDDSNQTVTVKVQNSDDNNDDKPTPSLKTTATEKVKGTKILTATTEQVVVDVVSYENLVAGKEYVMTGVLHKVAEDGSDAGAISKTETSVIFTPESSSGEISVELSVDATGMDGQKLVVFESCSLNDEVVATHEDIADEGQTVIVGASAIPIDNNENGNSANGGATGDSSESSSSGSSPQTGDLWGKRVMSEAIILMFFSGALMLMVRHFKKIQIASMNLG